MKSLSSVAHNQVLDNDLNARGFEKCPPKFKTRSGNMPLFAMLNMIPAFLALTTPLVAEETMGEKVAIEEQVLGEVALEPSYLSHNTGFVDESDLHLSVIPRARKSALLAGSMSFFVPGSGHFYLQDYKTAAALFGSEMTTLGLASSELLDRTSKFFAYETAFNLKLYNAYAAYRDARLFNRGEGYLFPMPQESLPTLLWAPFQWSVLKKPQVWGGLLGALTVGMGVAYLSSSDEESPSFSSFPNPYPAAAFAIGAGEEAFFRGFLQSALSEEFTPIGGIIASSILFGAAHLPKVMHFPTRSQRVHYLQYGIPFITAFGAYFGYLTYNNHSLKESTALHAWYDFTLFLISSSAIQSISYGRPTVGFSTSF